MFSLESIQKGNYCEIVALKQGNSCEATDFINALDRKNKRIYIKIFALLEFISENGMLKNEEKCKFIGDKKIWQIKVRVSNVTVRLFCFQRHVDNRFVILTHGWQKTDNRKEQNKELEKAVRLKKEFEEQFR